MSYISQAIPDTSLTKTKVFTINCSQAADTYDLATCTGGVLIESVQIFGQVVGATFTSVSVQTNNTVADEILSAVEGGVANIVAGANIKSYTTKTYLATTKKIQYTIDGSTGTGSCSAIVTYRPCVAGANLA